jgi:TFIIF-interacting CTD phosphatase-like protein
MIKFGKFNVTNTANGAKARVTYSHTTLIDGRECVTLYAKSYLNDLHKVFSDTAIYQNDTDPMSDYFDAGRVRIFSSHPLFSEAAARAA